MVFIEQQVDLRTTIGGGGTTTGATAIHLTSCVYNASGPRSGTSSALAMVAQSASGAVLTKSATLEKQMGNPQPRTYHHPDGMASFNSEGLPNNGIDYYISEECINETFQGMNKDNNETKKPLIISLSGKTLADNLEMMRRIGKASTLSQIASIELNLACPNVIGKPIIAYDVEQMDDILKQVSDLYNNRETMTTTPLPPLGVKLPPYLDFQHFAAAAKVLNKYKSVVKYVVAINTLGNSLCVDVTSEAPVIASNNGFAGLSGPAVKWTALANVKKLRELLDYSIDIVGVGGISTGKDAFEMLLCGASACQVATAHWKEGPGCFDRICQELQEIMSQNGYYSVSDVKNQLKPWSKEGAEKARQANKKAAAQEKDTAANKKAPGAGADPDVAKEAQLYKTISIVLAVLVGMLLTDKFMNVAPELLPPE